VTAPRSLAGDAKAIVFAAVLVLLTGCVFVFHADEDRIRGRIADDRRICSQLADARRTLRSRGRLEHERAELRARLRRVDLDGDRTAAAAAFVREAASIAARHHTTIASIAAVGAASGTLSTSGAPVSAPANPGALRPPADAFETIPLDITVEGRYADVLATIAALSAGRVPTAVDVASLARKQAGSADATLTAQLHVSIQRLAPASPANAATQPA
jgi:hypothetical protein